MKSILIRYFFLAIILSLSFKLAGCASSPYQTDAKARSDAMLATQITQATTMIGQSAEPRIIYAGFAMHSQSKAFRNDVLSGISMAEKIDAQAIIFKLNNPALGQDADWPYATAENIQIVLAEIGKLARDQDKIVLLFSTHGNINLLSVNASTTYYRGIDSQNLRDWLVPLRVKPTTLILSACYSGSFLEPLQLPNRIILTASAKDRTSFGCQFHSSNTFFIEALIGKTLDPSLSINQVADQASLGVARLEKAQNLSPPSMPQKFVGFAVKSFADQPLTAWRAYAAP